MSGIVSGIGKVFSTVGQAAARVGQAVLGVGAATTTAGVATQAAPMAAGGFNGVLQNLTGGGVLGNVISGAIKQAGYGALIGGAVGALTGQGFGKGALMGGLTGAVSGGLMSAARAGTPQAVDMTTTGSIPADTPTGFAPTGSTDYASVQTTGAVSPGSSGGGFGQFLRSQAGGQMLAGLGSGLLTGMAKKQEIEAYEREHNAQRQFEREKEQRIQDSYNIDPDAMFKPLGPDNSNRPTPGEKYGRFRYEYSPEAKRLVRVPA